MIILVGGTKGGSGKTTIVTNITSCLAADGLKVMLVDADPQGTSARWVERREDKAINENELPKIHCSQLTGNIYNTVLDLEQLYDCIVIDAGGSDSRELRTAMLAAHLFYVPLQASQFDLEQLVPLDEMLVTAQDQNTRLKVFGVLSRASSNPFNTESNEAKELLKQFPRFGLARGVIRDRKVYRDVTPLGRSVNECSNAKAKAEVQLLVKEIRNEAKI